MALPIRNISDLQGEIVRLKESEREQSIAIGARFKTFSSTVAALRTLFPQNITPDGKTSGFFDQDLVGLISRFVLPFTLNKTIFRNSGFIVKTLVGLISQKASHFISEDSVMSVWDKVKHLFSKKAKKENISDEKGIPPLSESY
ncbi:MAG TPA: hypothetical protein VIM55_03795 [Mucilaginibacter sp.]